jgi:hypothetical protein
MAGFSRARKAFLEPAPGVPQKSIKDGCGTLKKNFKN